MPRRTWGHCWIKIWYLFHISMFAKSFLQISMYSVYSSHQCTAQKMVEHRGISKQKSMTVSFQDSHPAFNPRLRMPATVVLLRAGISFSWFLQVLGRGECIIITSFHQHDYRWCSFYLCEHPALSLFDLWAHFTFKISLPLRSSCCCYLLRVRPLILHYLCPSEFWHNLGQIDKYVFRHCAPCYWIIIRFYRNLWSL